MIESEGPPSHISEKERPTIKSHPSQTTDPPVPTLRLSERVGLTLRRRRCLYSAPIASKTHVSFQTRFARSSTDTAISPYSISIFTLQYQPYIQHLSKRPKIKLPLSIFLFQLVPLSSTPCITVSLSHSISPIFRHPSRNLFLRIDINLIVPTPAKTQSALKLRASGPVTSLPDQKSLAVIIGSLTSLRERNPKSIAIILVKSHTLILPFIHPPSHAGLKVHYRTSCESAQSTDRGSVCM